MAVIRRFDSEDYFAEVSEYSYAGHGLTGKFIASVYFKGEYQPRMYRGVPTTLELAVSDAQQMLASAQSTREA